MKTPLKIVNNWESLEYMLGDEEIDPHNITFVEIKGNVYKIIDYSRVRATYSDWGRETSVYQTHLFIQSGDFKVNVTDCITKEKMEVFVI